MVQVAKPMMMKATTPASGNVPIHESKIVRTVAIDSVPALAPTPVIAPTETCVVDTGKLLKLAASTKAAVIKLAVSPCADVSGVILWLIVSATRRDIKRPPAATAVAIAINEIVGLLPFATTINPANFGVSLTERAKQMVAAELMCARLIVLEMDARAAPAPWIAQASLVSITTSGVNVL